MKLLNFETSRGYTAINPDYIIFAERGVKLNETHVLLSNNRTIVINEYLASVVAAVSGDE